MAVSETAAIAKFACPACGGEAIWNPAKQKLVCHSCGTAVGYNVAKFCWFNKPKFGGNIYCMDCQKTVVST